MVQSDKVVQAPADTVFTNAKVYTVNEKQLWADAVAVKDGKIIFVGNNAGARALIGNSTEATDLQGRMLMPGFVSEHDHLIATKWTSYGVDLSETKTVDEALEKIKAYANANPDKKVILGYGFNRLTYGRWPNKAELDTVICHRPAFLLDFTIHDAWLNSKAFEAGGVPADVEDPVPDTIYWQRDDTGELTGISIEFAWFDAYIAAGAWQPKEMIAESHQEYMAYMVGTGMTTFHAPAIVTPNATNVPSSPLSDTAPLVSVEASITLKDVNNEDSVRFPPEGVRDVADIAMALKTVTIYPAYQLRMEDKIGSIEVGKYADLVILEKNLFDLPPNRVAETKVNATILEGKYTYRDGI